MFKKWVWVVIAIILFIGIIGMNKGIELTTKEKQIAFLKKHENEMTEFIKKEDSKIARIDYKWSTLQNEVAGNGLPQGADEILTLRVKLIDEHGTKINSFGFAVIPDDIEDPVRIKEMYTINADYSSAEGDT